MKYPVRINAYLRDIGVCSRHEADDLISGGLVTINRNRAVPGQYVQEGDNVIVSKKFHKNYVYLAFNKPRGLATQGNLGGASVITEWEKKGIYPLGRLDKESEGLMILTNDGRITGKVLGDKDSFEKEYTVTVQEKLRSGLVGIFAKGMTTKKYGKLLPVEAKIRDDSNIQLVLREGKKHQIRIMLDELRYTITRLQRTRIGKIRLASLKPGKSRPLSEAEIASFFR